MEIRMAYSRRTLAATLLTALLLTGCQQADDESTAQPKDATGAYPVTVKAGNGEVTIPAKPKRIVSLAPTTTEMLYAIGAGDQVVAVDELSNFPAEAPDSKLSGFKPNAEAVISYSPDLVIATNDTDDLVAALTKVKIPVLLEPAAATLDDTYDQLTDLGTATGHEAEAAKVNADIEAKVDDIVAKTPKPSTQLRYYHELDTTYFSVTSKTFLGQIYSKFGLQNIADAADPKATGYPQLSQEYIVKANPDLVFLGDTKCCQQTAATVAKRPAWANLNAVKGGGVVELDDDIASRWGPRVVDLVQAIADAVSKVAQPK
jgi:iron complex transport system substrate-binding protein